MGFGVYAPEPFYVLVSLSLVYIYIYIYMCVCVCVRVLLLLLKCLLESPHTRCVVGFERMFTRCLSGFVAGL